MRPAGRVSKRTLYSAFGVVTTTVRGPGELEHDPFERRQPAWLEVLDHLHQHGRVVASQPVVAIGQRTLEQLQSSSLALVHPVEAQPPCRGLQGAGRHVHADDVAEPMVRDELREQPAFAAAKVEHLGRAARPQRRHDRPNPLVGQADRSFDDGLLVVPPGRLRLGILPLARRELSERLARQVRLPGEIAARDQLALRVRTEPAVPSAEQLLDLRLARPSSASARRGPE